MKFEDVKVGQILEDAHDNRFEVVNIDTNNKYYSILVKCIRFKGVIKQVDGFTKFTHAKQRLYILRDRSMLLPIHDGFGKYIKDNFYSNLVLVGNLEPITVDICGIKKHYLLAQQSTIDKITLTLSDLKIVEDDYLTLSNVKVGSKVIDGIGNEYVVIDFNTEAVKLSHNTKFTSMDGTSKNIVAIVRVPYYNDNMSEDVCTTKDFQIVREN